MKQQQQVEGALIIIEFKSSPIEDGGGDQVGPNK